MKMILSSNRPVQMLFSLCLLSLLAAEFSFAAPRLHCEDPNFDFGTLIGRDEIVHEFILENTGDEPVRIANIKNCCGVTSSIEPMVIEPGSNAVCKSIFNIKNRNGKQEKQILVATNDPKRPYLELRMSGILKKAIEVTPRYLRVGELSQNGEITQTIEAESLLDEEVLLESVTSTIPGIKAEVVGEGGDLANWTIRLSNHGGLAVGKLRGQIRLNFSSGMVTVPVMGSVKPAIQSIPEKVKLSGKSGKPVERQVMLRSENPFEVSAAELMDVDGTVDVKKLTDQKWKLTLVLDPASVKTDAHVRVSTTEALQPTISVPINL